MMLYPLLVRLRKMGRYTPHKTLTTIFGQKTLLNLAMINKFDITLILIEAIVVAMAIVIASQI